MKTKILEKHLSTLMQTHKFEDYAPNGLQVEGRENIQRLLVSPSISIKVIEKAVELGADAILVHHGLFWKNEPRQISGTLRRKIKELLMHDINLFAYHLPLDFLPKYGNNEPVLRVLKLKNIQPFENIGYSGIFQRPIEPENFSSLLDNYYQTKGIHIPKTGKIQRVVIVSGGGASYFQKAIFENFPFDAFITGEGTEWVYNLAKENNTAFSAMGHYKSEMVGVKLLGKYLETKFKLKVDWFAEENPF